jgi:hypothetical protein
LAISLEDKKITEYRQSNERCQPVKQPENLAHATFFDEAGGKLHVVYATGLVYLGYGKRGMVHNR